MTDSAVVDTEIEEHGSKPVSLARRIAALVGVGIQLLLLGLLLEGLTVVVQQWVSCPIALATATQVLITGLCLAVCLLGAAWFSRSLNLIKVHLRNGKIELVTDGPFAYVRHPLYSTLVITIPPLVVVWLADLLFLVPWILILVISHPVVRLEERGLIEAFGEDYERYRERVPALLPYKGAAGKRCLRDER